MKTFLIALKTQLLEFHGIASDIFTFKNVFTPSAIVPLIFSGILALNFSNLLLLFFLIFYFLDFATGILATTIEIKNNPDKYAELKERKGKVYWIESERIVRGIVKMVIYIQLILLSNLITVAIDNKQFQLHQSVIPLSIYEIMLCLCITAEFVSNLENSKRAGFDIIQLLSDGFSKFWRIFRVIKTGKDE
jgi:hypothetical protein